MAEPLPPEARRAWARGLDEPDCYNRAVLRAGRRRVGIAVLALLFAGALGLSHAPLDLGGLRVGGVSILWWYAVVVAPSLAAPVTAMVLLRSRD